MGRMVSTQTLRTTGLLSIVAALLLISFQASTAARADSIGIAPTSFDFENLARGQEYARTINVFHDSEEARSFQFSATGELAEWISFFNIETGETIEILEVPHTGLRSKGAVGLKITVPEDAANGFYDSAIRVSGVAGDVAAGSSAATVGASIRVFADVTGDQVLGGSLLDAAAISIETGFPLRVDLRLENSGNVKITPTFEIVITDEADEEVARHNVTVESIGPQELASREFEIDVDQLRLGDFTARVTGSFLDLDLGSSTVRFTIFERGTLTRSGTLKGISLTNDPIAGEIARILVEFQNTGEIEANAVFVGEITRDGQLVDVITSLPQLVQAGQFGEIDVFVDADVAGDYTITGKVNFDGKESQPVEINFNVPATRDVPAGDAGGQTTGGSGAQVPATGDEEPSVDSGSGSGVVILVIVLIVVVVLVTGFGIAGYIAYRYGWQPPTDLSGVKQSAIKLREAAGPKLRQAGQRTKQTGARIRRSISRPKSTDGSTQL